MDHRLLGRGVPFALAMLASLHGPARPALAQGSPRPWGRISFFATTSQITSPDAPSRSYSEFVTTATYRSPELETAGAEYALDMRAAGYTIEGRDPRVSFYEAWAGASMAGGAWRVRGGQMWLNDLGALGSVAGGAVEYRRKLRVGRLRVGGFGGLEPKTFETGYVPDVNRFGAYTAFDGAGLNRYVVGYVQIRDAGLTERSVLTTTNYVPIGQRVFVYQSAEIDLQGPAGQGSGGLTYFFLNARASASKQIELQGSFHRGRSLDTRGITLDQLNGRPVALKSLEGLLFESASGRVTVNVVRSVRVFAGYGRDRNNRDSDATGRFTAGGYASSLFQTGVDLTASLSRIDRGAPGSYDSWFLSLGRSLGRRVYLSGEYSSSLSVVRFTRSDGVIIESRPETRRFGLNGNINLTRIFSVLVIAERTDDEASAETRVLTGLTCRFP